MTPEILSSPVAGDRADVHVWMTPQDAADRLCTSVTSVDRQLDAGDLDSRVDQDGTLQVLVRLTNLSGIDPELEPEPEFVASIEPTRTTVSRTITPPAASVTSDEPLRFARRSARLAWTATAAMVMLTATAGWFAAKSLVKTQDQSRQMSLQLAHATQDARQLTAQRDQLRGQLAEAGQTLTRTQQDLVVERSVEDTLIKAAIAAHGKNAQPKRQVFADSSN